MPTFCRACLSAATIARNVRADLPGQKCRQPLVLRHWQESGFRVGPLGKDSAREFELYCTRNSINRKNRQRVLLPAAQPAASDLVPY